jgi:hypothetical protein
MASNIQSEINKKNKLNVDKVLDWITGYFDDQSVSRRGRRYSSAAQKKRIVNKAKKIAREPLKSDTVVTQTSLKNEIKKELDPEFFAKPSANRMEKNVNKKAASKPKAKPKREIEDFNKSVKGAKSAVEKRKAAQKLDDDAIKAKRRADARKESKSQPGGPSSAPKDKPKVSKKKEDKSVKESLKDMLLKQDKRTMDTPIGKLTVDSTDEGMSKFLGSKEDIERQEMEEEMNLYRGGMAFGKGGMYKGPKKAYGMRKGGFTNRGQMS